MDKRINIGDVELHVEVHGSGPPLLLAHGFPLDHTMWRGQIEGLADVARVIAPDLRGFGKSDVTEGLVTMEQLADDLAQLLDALGVDVPVCFCGLSMGGYVAWQFVRRHRARLGRLILCDTRAVADDAQAARGRLDMAERLAVEGASLAAEAMMPRLFCEASWRDQPAVVEVTRQVMLATDPAAIAAAQRGMAQRIDATSLLPQIDVPTLVVCGQHDAISRVEEMRGIAAKIPQARFAEIEGAGHMAPLEDPAAVNAAIHDFLAAG